MTSSPTTSPHPHVAEGVFADRGGETVLIGSRCPRCGALDFPRRESCANPVCLGAVAEPWDLRGPGVVHTFTVQHYPPPAPFDLVDAPYAIVGVDLEVPIRVVGLYDGDPDTLQIGHPVRMATLEARRGDDTVLTWAFTPQQEVARA